MLVFWLSALALVVVTLALLLPPLLRSPRAARGDHGLEVYRARVAALEEEHRIGALAEPDLEEAKAELARELLDQGGPETPSPPAAGAARRSRGPWLAVAVGVGIPLLTIALYQRLGDPAALDPRLVAGAGSAGGGDAVVPDVESMVARLAERLRREPDNSEGWLMLGRSYMALERYPEAAEAYATAHRLLGDSAELLADLAEAEALAGGQNFLGAPGERLETALALEPDHPKALWLGAFAALQRGDAVLAVARWQALLNRQPPDSEAAAVLRGLIANAGAAPADAPPVAAAEGLTVTVTVADRLATALRGDETLFVFARAVNGPPMPLAVVRRPVTDLPLTVTLDDSMSMAADRRLSDADRVVVGARISAGGTATPASGDLQGFSDPVPASGGPAVSVIISEQVP